MIVARSWENVTFCDDPDPEHQRFQQSLRHLWLVSYAGSSSDGQVVADGVEHWKDGKSGSGYGAQGLSIGYEAPPAPVKHFLSFGPPRLTSFGAVAGLVQEWE